jgi:hypothetical protein
MKKSTSSPSNSLVGAAGGRRSMFWTGWFFGGSGGKG